MPYLTPEEQAVEIRRIKATDAWPQDPLYVKRPSEGYGPLTCGRLYAGDVDRAGPPALGLRIYNSFPDDESPAYWDYPTVEDLVRDGWMGD